MLRGGVGLGLFVDEPHPLTDIPPDYLTYEPWAEVYYPSDAYADSRLWEDAIMPGEHVLLVGYLDLASVLERMPHDMSEQVRRRLGATYDPTWPLIPRLLLPNGRIVLLERGDLEYFKRRDPQPNLVDL